MNPEALSEGAVRFPPTARLQRDTTQIPPDLQGDRVHLGGPATLVQPPAHVDARQTKAQALVGEVDGLRLAPGVRLLLYFNRRPDERQSISRTAPRKMLQTCLKTVLRLLYEHAILLVCGLDHASCVAPRSGSRFN